MTSDEFQRLVAEVQKRQSELNNVEIKSAHAGTPKRLYESRATTHPSDLLLPGLNPQVSPKYPQYSVDKILDTVLATVLSTRVPTISSQTRLLRASASRNVPLGRRARQRVSAPSQFADDLLPNRRRANARAASATNPAASSTTVPGSGTVIGEDSA